MPRRSLLIHTGRHPIRLDHREFNPRNAPTTAGRTIRHGLRSVQWRDPSRPRPCIRQLRPLHRRRRCHPADRPQRCGAQRVAACRCSSTDHRPRAQCRTHRRHRRSADTARQLTRRHLRQPHRRPGEKLWEWGTEAPGGAARQNHDWELLESGNRLILVAIPREVPALGPHIVGDQGLYEVAPDGRIVWDWRAGDHLDELGFTPEGFEYLRRSVARQPDNIWGYLEINSANTLGPNHWHRDDPNTVFHPDNILISSRKANIIALIDKGTGKIVWRLGPYFDAEPGAEHQRINSHGLPRPLDQISGQHNPHLIAVGLPGAGNLLVFDNQGGAGYPPAPLGIYAGSRVLEIDPVTKHIVWQYTAEDSGRPSWTFFSSFVSNAQRLPNGNTLITEGMHGRIFQVTPSGQVVWEYLTPYRITPSQANPR